MTTPDQAAPSHTGNAFNKDLLHVFYSQLFPFELLYSWLAYDHNYLYPTKKEDNKMAPESFRFREVSFESEIDGREIYSRFLSFNSMEDFRATVIKRLPHKIDFGGVYPYPPKDKATRPKGNSFKALTKELIFDVDLTDYDSVRMCGCQDKKICLKCWQMATMAIKVVDAALRQDFGFKHIAWIYSGRRGVHCWVADPQARELDDSARDAVVSYFSVVDKKSANPVGLSSPLHPLFTRSYSILEPMFLEHICPETGHGLLAIPEKWEPLLDRLPRVALPVKSALLEKWSEEVSTPQEKWLDLKEHLQIFAHPKGTKKSRKESDLSYSDKSEIDQWPVVTVFYYCYPRLDTAVSVHRDHLLKSPFCVHPGTGRVCVPIDMRRVESFDPFQVPTMGQVISDLDNVEAETKEKWRRTRLADYFGPFEKDFLKPMLKEVARLERKIKEEEAATRADF